MDVVVRRESVCRSLFGPVDHEQLRRDLQLKLREITEQDSRRWNFCFHSETPLPGSFQWEEVPADCTAAFYQDSAQPRDAVSGPTSEDDDRLGHEEEEGAGTDQENCSSISNACKRSAELTPVRRKRKLPKPAAEPSITARITDFFPKRRRSTETKITLNPFHTGSSEAAQCRTIR